MSDEFALIVPVVPAREVAAKDDELRNEMGARGSNKDIRRPLDALTLPDDSYATISLLSGGTLKNTSVATGTSSSNANILIQSLSYSVSEKHQRAQTFDRDRLFFFGQALPSLSISAKTLDTLTFQWLQELYENYATRIGGSVSAENGAKVQITSDNRVYTGYILDLRFTKTSQDRYMADVAFTMALTNLKHLKRLRSTVDGKDLDQIDIADALSDISELIIQSESAEASLSASLASQSSTQSRVATPITKDSYAFKDIYVNEYPNRSYGMLTQRSFVDDPVVVETVPINYSKDVGFEIRNILSRIGHETSNITERANLKVNARDAQNLYKQLEKSVGVIVVPDEMVGASLADAESPSVRPVSTTSLLKADADALESVPEFVNKLLDVIRS
jgi:hypothetical protein